MNIKRRIFLSFFAFVLLAITVTLGSRLPDETATVAALRPRLASLYRGEPQNDVLQILGFGTNVHPRSSFGCLHRSTYVYSLGPNHELELLFLSSEGLAHARLTTSGHFRSVDESWPRPAHVYSVTLVTREQQQK